MNLFHRRDSIGTVCFNLKPVRGPWGGSSLFVSQLSKYLRNLGYKVTYTLTPDVDIIVLVDPRKDQKNKPFGLEEIRHFKSQKPSVRVLHRINECDQRKNSDFMDSMLKEANELADFTVFISSWLAEYHSKKWFDSARPHRVIYNGADPAVFHPVGSSRYRAGDTFRIITHHWSGHWLKGFDKYVIVDEMIADKVLDNVELIIMGRYPTEIKWKSATLVPPLQGPEMARQLRAAHAYITASRWEPCGMHHVEGAQCGLPLIYHEDGGGIVEAGKIYGVGFSDDIDRAITEMQDNWMEYRRRVLGNQPSGDLMCIEFCRVIQMIADKAC